MASSREQEDAIIPRRRITVETAKVLALKRNLFHFPDALWTVVGTPGVNGLSAAPPVASEDMPHVRDNAIYQDQLTEADSAMETAPKRSRVTVLHALLTEAGLAGANGPNAVLPAVTEAVLQGQGLATILNQLIMDDSAMESAKRASLAQPHPVRPTVYGADGANGLLAVSPAGKRESSRETADATIHHHTTLEETVREYHSNPRTALLLLALLMADGVIGDLGPDLVSAVDMEELQPGKGPAVDLHLHMEDKTAKEFRQTLNMSSKYRATIGLNGHCGPNAFRNAVSLRTRKEYAIAS